MSWVFDEMGEMDLGDARLENRAIKLLEQLGKKTTDSIPVACETWNETKAAYRFFDNDKVTPEKILAPHLKATINRIKNEKIVLLIQDTTELNYAGQKEKKHVGPSHNPTDKTRFLHPMIAVTPEKKPLGVIDDFSWYRRKFRRENINKEELKTYLRNCPIELKETYRWLLGYKKACMIAERCQDTHIICIGDRESDIYEIFHEAEQRDIKKRADWLVRVKTDRILSDEDGDHAPLSLYETLEKESKIGRITIIVPKQGNNKKRKATLVVKIKRVRLHPPVGNIELEPVNATVISTSELNPPEDCEPVQWKLLTNVYGDSMQDAKKFMKWYLARWQIEVFFKTLKTGCKIEANQLTEESRFLPCITMHLIISWRIMYITHVSRTNPKLSCEHCFSRVEWQTIYKLGKKKKPPQKPPNIEEITRLLAMRGGYLNRKSDGPPGPKSIWLGLKQINDAIFAMEVMKKLEEI